MRISSLVATPVLALALAVVPLTTAGASSPATIALGCTATVSDVHPAPNSRVTVVVTDTAAGVKTVAVARLKSGAVTNAAAGSATGRAAVSLKIGNATRGQRVPVTLKAVKGNLQWTCATSFVVR